MNNLEVIAIMANDRMKRDAFHFNGEVILVKDQENESKIHSMYADPRLKMFVLEQPEKPAYRCYSLQEAVEALLIAINS
jgi:hypothetical protein